MKRHDLQEISTKLRLADDMMSDGKSQKDVCKSLGISVMTFHRWRKLPPSTGSFPPVSEAEQGPAAASVMDRSNVIDDLKLENHRLRRIVSDLLLEKMKVQEALEKAKKWIAFDPQDAWIYKVRRTAVELEYSDRLAKANLTSLTLC